jgi:hypothetical protein
VPRFAAAFAGIVLLLDATGCTQKHQAAASAAAAADAVAAQPPLKSCDARTFQAGGADVTLDANLDGSVGSLKIQNADPALRAQILSLVRKRFGVPKRDPRVFTRAGKWGLTVMMDACGRPLDLSGAKPSPSP